MKQIILAAILLICVSESSAQYIYYRQKLANSIKQTENMGSAPREKVQEQPKSVVETMIEQEPEPIVRAKFEKAESIKLTAPKVELAKVEAVKLEPVKEPLKPEPPSEKVYKTYPDKCPGVEGATPWCLSYVPDLLKKILVDRYEGYLMTIKGVIQEDKSILYYCQICSDGVMVTEYAKENGEKVVKK